MRVLALAGSHVASSYEFWHLQASSPDATHGQGNLLRQLVAWIKEAEPLTEKKFAS